MRWVNNLSARLQTAITSSDTVIRTDRDVAFPLHMPATIEDAQGNIEIVLIVGREASGLHVLRGMEGTTPKSFPAGAKVEQRVTAGTLYELSSDAILTDGAEVLVDGDGNVLTESNYGG